MLWNLITGKRNVVKFLEGKHLINFTFPILSGVAEPLGWPFNFGISIRGDLLVLMLKISIIQCMYWE